MRPSSCLGWAAVLISLAGPASSQQPSSEPSTPTTPAPQPAAAQATATIHASADLVIVDVVVSDAKHGAVRHLTPADFTVLEDGHPQTLKAFEEHAPGPPPPPASMPKLPPGMFTNYTPAPPAGALNILLLDKLNTPMEAQATVRDEVLKYLKEVPTGTHMAIFTLTTELRMLQGFTSDTELLRAIVAGKKGLPGASPLMENAVAGDHPSDENMADEFADTIGATPGDDPDVATMIQTMEQFEEQLQSYQLQLRVDTTLDALNLLARYLGKLPGRKNLIWFSGSFPISLLPEPGVQNPFALQAATSTAPITQNPFAAVFDKENEFRETVDLLARAQVAVYPIDARGLMNDAAMSTTNTGSRYTRYGQNPGAFTQDESNNFFQTAGEHGVMQQMADATGGHAFVNTNGLKQAIGDAIEEGSSYYSLAFRPSDPAPDGKYRKIEVKLDRPGVALKYRRGYYADDPSAPAGRKDTKSDAAVAGPYNPLKTALIHGAPDPMEILFTAAVRPSTAQTQDAAAKDNTASPKVKGPFREYTLNIHVNPADVRWQTGDGGAHQYALQFVSFVYDRDGILVNRTENTVRSSIPGAKFSDVLKGVLGYRQQVSVPIKGEYYLRVAVRDLEDNRVGALELPIDAVARLAPLDAPNPAAPPQTPAPSTAKP